MLSPLRSNQVGNILPYFAVAFAFCFAVGHLALFLIETFSIEVELWLKVIVYFAPLILFLFLGECIEAFAHWFRVSILKKNYYCPCCGYQSLQKKPPGSKEVCSVCKWIDDYMQQMYTDSAEGLNALSFREHQDQFISSAEQSHALIELERDPLWHRLPRLTPVKDKEEIAQISIEWGDPDHLTALMTIAVNGCYEQYGFFEMASKPACKEGAAVFKEICELIQGDVFDPMLKFDSLKAVKAHTRKQLLSIDDSLQAEDHPLTVLCFDMRCGFYADFNMADIGAPDAALISSPLNQFILKALHIAHRYQGQ